MEWKAENPWEPSPSDLGCEVAPSAVAITEEALAEYRAVGRLYLKKLVEWGLRKCDMHTGKYARFDCTLCMAELRRQVGLT